MLQLLCSAIRNKRGENPKLDAGSVTVQPEPKGNAREKKKKKMKHTISKYAIQVINV
jgi:hypothetical protein